MDTHCLFASREDLCHIQEEVKAIYATQLDHSERLVRLERRRQDDARMKNVWGTSAFPLSPLPSFGAGSGSGSVGSGVLGGEAESLSGSRAGTPGVGFGSALNPGAEPFRGASVIHTTAGHGHDDTGVSEPKRAQISRANSVRFDETSIQQPQSPSFPMSSYSPLAPNRPLPDTAHCGSRYGFGCPTIAGMHPTSQSSSRRPESRLGTSQSCKNSHFTSAAAHRQDSAIRLMSSMEESLSASTPLAPPPGLLYLGPVPCIIRCWLTTHFSSDSLIYAAVCSGSYHSTVGFSLVRRLGLEDSIVVEPTEDSRNEDEEVSRSRSIKLPVYLPEASVYNPLHPDKASEHHLPALTVYFVIREDEDRADDDKSIQVVLGSDVLRAHNADILFSQDRVTIVDDERSKISIPLVRPENVATYNTLSTASDLEWRRSTRYKRERRLIDPLPERPDSQECDMAENGGKSSVEKRSTSLSGADDLSGLTKARQVDRDSAPSPGRTARPSLSPQPSVESIDTGTFAPTWQIGRQPSTSSQGADSSTDIISGISATLSQQENVRPKSRASERSWATSSSARHGNQGPWATSASASASVNNDVHAHDSGVGIGLSGGSAGYQGTTSNANKTSSSNSVSVWGPWRRETGANGYNANGSSASTTSFSRSNSTTEIPNRGGRGGRTMKVLKPNKLTTTRQLSFSSSGGHRTPTEAINGHSRGEDGYQSSRWGSAEDGSTAAKSPMAESAMTQSAQPPTLRLVTSKMRSSANPVGGASAFGWLNNSTGNGDKPSE
ncbi:hypothetical protein KEM54_001712 [Ascosphaera aggregata]|nr:hypothetical protein KEM54_001712 [Ascosphaera aggregata]